MTVNYIFLSSGLVPVSGPGFNTRPENLTGLVSMAAARSESSSCSSTTVESLDGVAFVGDSPPMADQTALDGLTIRKLPGSGWFRVFFSGQQVPIHVFELAGIRRRIAVFQSSEYFIKVGGAAANGAIPVGDNFSMTVEVTPDLEGRIASANAQRNDVLHVGVAQHFNGGSLAIIHEFSGFFHVRIDVLTTVPEANGNDMLEVSRSIFYDDYTAALQQLVISPNVLAMLNAISAKLQVWFLLVSTFIIISFI